MEILRTYLVVINLRVVCTDTIRMGLSQSKNREGSAAQTEPGGLQMTGQCILQIPLGKSVFIFIHKPKILI